MKNKIIRYTYLAVGLLCLGCLFSCTESEGPEPEVRELSVETDLLHFGRAAEETSVAIATGGQSWRAFPDADWIFTSEEEDRLRIRVGENKSPDARSSSVRIETEGAARTIRITQEGAGVRIDWTDSSITLSYLGGTTESFYRSNMSPDWSVVCHADWVEVQLDHNKQRCTFVIDPNDALEQREAVVKIFSGGKQLEQSLTIRQEGVPALFIPYTAWGDNIAAIRSFEEGRGNSVYRVPDQFFYSAWGFKTPSPYFNFIEYSLSGRGYYEARLYASKDFASQATLPEGKEMVESFLLSNGFVRVEDEANVYLNEELMTVATLVKAPKPSGINVPYPYIKYELYPKQEQDYPTLSLDDLLGVFTLYKGKRLYTPLEEEYEKEKGGGTFVPEKSSKNTKFYSLEYPGMYRMYDISGIGITAAYTGYEDIHLFMFQDAIGNYHLTKAFEQVMEDAKFYLESVMEMGNSRRYKFMHDERRINFVVYLNRNNHSEGKEIAVTKVSGY